MSVSVGYYRNGFAHLDGEIERVRRLLKVRIARDQARGRLGPETDVLARGYISADSVMLDLGHTRDPDQAPHEQLDALAAQEAEIAAQIQRAHDVGVELPLPALERDFGLSRFARDLLVIAVAAELDGGVRRALGFIQDDITRQFLDFEVASTLLLDEPEARAAARHDLDVDAPLMMHRLVAQPEGFAADAFSVLRMPLRPPRRVVEHLLGRTEVDVPLRAAVRVEARETARRGIIEALTLSAGARAQLERQLQRCQGLCAETGSVFMLVFGPAGVGKTVVARELAGRLDRRVMQVRVDLLTVDADMVSRVAREARLQRALAVITGAERLDDAARRLLFSLLEGDIAPVVIESRAPLATSVTRSVVRLEMGPPDSAQRVELWRQGLEARGLPTDEAAHLGVKYRVTGGTIVDASARISANATGGLTRGALLEAIETTLADQRQHALGDLAQRVVARGTWDQLVVPDSTRDELRELVESYRHRSRILLEWGFEKVLSTGQGISALFEGPPGTGKTLAAGVIATEFDMELFQVDVSRIVSKWIGETEKNLDAIFDEAEKAHAILLFDEADSLFSKRTDVKSSQDRSANLQLNFLLQKMDRYRGITILTSNMGDSIDPAFARRIGFRIKFPEPSQQERERLWQTLVPPEMPVDEPLEADYLAEVLELTGGHIRNVLLRAAVLAARAGSGLTMDHVLEAGRAEYRALGRLVRF